MYSDDLFETKLSTYYQSICGMVSMVDRGLSPPTKK